MPSGPASVSRRNRFVQSGWHIRSALVIACLMPRIAFCCSVLSPALNPAYCIIVFLELLMQKGCLFILKLEPNIRGRGQCQRECQYYEFHPLDIQTDRILGASAVPVKLILVCVPSAALMYCSRCAMPASQRQIPANLISCGVRAGTRSDTDVGLSQGFFQLDFISRFLVSAPLYATQHTHRIYATQDVFSTGTRHREPKPTHRTMFDFSLDTHSVHRRVLAYMTQHRAVQPLFRKKHTT
jgi:hypothetical protein